MDPLFFGLIFGVGVFIALGLGWAKQQEVDRAAASAAPASVGAPDPDASTAQQTGPSSALTTSQEPSQGELIFWQSINDSKDPAEFAAYLGQFPSGFFRQLARNRLIVLGGTPPDEKSSASVGAEKNPSPQADTEQIKTQRQKKENERGWIRVWIVASIMIWGGGFFWLQSINYSYVQGLEASAQWPFYMPPFQPDHGQPTDDWSYDWGVWLARSGEAGHLWLVIFGPLILGALMLGVSWISRGFRTQPAQRTADANERRPVGPSPSDGV